MKTELLYLTNSYLQEFEAVVKEVNNDKYVVLDKTCFYYSSGGQPHDTGKLIKNEEEFNVVYVGKFSGNISHEVDKPGLKIGDKVKGIIDWDRRYKFMRYHTASHILSTLINKKTGALITGNQIGLDSTRVDFSLENFDREKFNEYVEEANKIIDQNLQIQHQQLFC